MKARFGIWAHLSLLFALAKMIIHHGITLLSKYSWKEITKKYREGIWLSFCSQGNGSRVESSAMSSQQKGTIRRVPGPGPAPLGHECHEQLRGGKGPKSLRNQRHQHWAQPDCPFHRNSPADCFLNVCVHKLKGFRQWVPS